MALFGKKQKEFDYYRTRDYFEKNKSLEDRNFLEFQDWLTPEYDELGNFTEDADELNMLFDPMIQDEFYTKGKIYPGVLVQANTLLFERGKDNCPAAYFYTDDEYYIKNPQELIELAHILFWIKGKQGYMPSVQALVDTLTDEEKRAFAYRLPRDLTENRNVYLTTVYVDRKHLAEKKLTEEPLMPLIVLEGRIPDAMILPYWFWR